MTDAARPRLSCRPVPTRRRAVTGVALSAAAAVLLTGCGQLKLGSAAVVGDERVTDERVQSLVDESLAAPGVRAALPASDYKGDLGAYRRAVLNVEVERLLVENAVQRLGIPVDESRVDARYRYFESQAGGTGQFAAELASRLAVSPALYRQLVRTEVLEAEIGYEQGGVKRPTETQLRALYRQALPEAVTATLSLIQLPDAATATRVLAELTANPESFDQVAARYATTPEAKAAAQPRKYPVGRLPADLAARAQRAQPGEIFGYRLSDGNAQAYFVIRSGGVTRPSLDSLRPQLEAQALQQAAAAGQKYLSQVARDVGVDVNPRYGTWQPDKLTITDFVNPVVKPTPSPAPSGATVPGAGNPAEPGASPTPGG